MNFVIILKNPEGGRPTIIWFPQTQNLVDHAAGQRFDTH